MLKSKMLVGHVEFITYYFYLCKNPGSTYLAMYHLYTMYLSFSSVYVCAVSTSLPNQPLPALQLTTTIPPNSCQSQPHFSVISSRSPRDHSDQPTTVHSGHRTSSPTLTRHILHFHHPHLLRLSTAPT